MIRKCECQSDHGTCCGGDGPAAFEVTRDDERVAICTRCLLPGATEGVFIADLDEAEVYQRYDEPGWLLAVFSRDREQMN